MASMVSKLKQFKDLRSQAKSVQNALSQETVHGTGAGSKVQVVMDGNQKILSVDVDESLLSVDQKDTLEKGIVQAVESANKELQKVMAKKLRSGEMEMPDLSSLM